MSLPIEPTCSPGYSSLTWTSQTWVCLVCQLLRTTHQTPKFSQTRTLTLAQGKHWPPFFNALLFFFTIILSNHICYKISTFLDESFVMNWWFVERLFIQLNDCSMCVCCVSTQCRRNSVCNFRSLISCQPVDAKWYNYNNRYKMQIRPRANTTKLKFQP